MTPLWREQAVEATATITFQSLPRPTRELVLHAKDLRLGTIRSTLELEGHQNTGEEIILTFKENIPPHGEHRLSIDYKAFPDRGLYFRTAEMGYNPEDEHIYVHLPFGSKLRASGPIETVTGADELV